MDIVIWIIFFVGFSNIIFGNVVHFKVVLPVLRKFDGNVSMTGMPSKQKQQIIRYKELCDQHGLELRWYRYLNYFDYISFFLLACWIAALAYTEFFI
jgi:hypothetical protein